MSLMKSAATVGGLTMVSRVLGFLRDMMLGWFLGAGMAADAFFVAFKLPNFFRRLFAEGAFSAAFVPMFAEHNAEGRGKKFAEEVLAALLPILLLFTALVEAAMPAVVWAITGGFKDGDPAKFALTVDLTRTTFPFLMLISLVSLLAGILNGLGKFAAAAAAPIILNLTMIASLLWFHETQVATARALAFAVTLSGILQFIWLLMVAKKLNYAPRLRWPKLSPPVRDMLLIMAPAAIGAGAMQVNLLVDTVLATRFLPEGSLSFLYYGDRLNQLPLGVIGIAVGTVLLPTLSRQIAGGDITAAQHSQNRAIELALLLTLPAAVALMVVPDALIRVLFERGAFDAQATRSTAAALAAYAAGLPAYVLIKVLTPGFYARKDTRTPLNVALIAVACNTVLGIMLMFPLAHVGLALATALSAWLNAALLYINLRRRDHYAIDAPLRRRGFAMLASVAVLAPILWLAADFLNNLLMASGLMALSGLISLVAIGVASYALMAWMTGAVDKNRWRQP